MSDMIDRLDAIAREAGARTSAVLMQEEVRIGIESRVRSQVHRRRVRRSLAAVAVVAVAAVGVWAVPRLMPEEPLPATPPVREVVSTADGLLTYSDGSMSIATASGRVFQLAAPGPDDPSYKVRGEQSACAANDFEAHDLGWDVHATDAMALITFGRPILVDAAGNQQVIAQGQSLGHVDEGGAFAFSVDVDPAIAPHIVVALDSVAIGADGTPMYYSTTLDSEPTVVMSGDAASGTANAAVTTRPMKYGDYCTAWAEPMEGVAYPMQMRATVFVSDGQGADIPIATHYSWFSMTKEST